MPWRGGRFPPPPPTMDMLWAGAQRCIEELEDEGRELAPVARISGRLIAKTFWGTAWCENLLRYSDYENRMPRGRRYVRSGSVIHLAIGPGEVAALVSGTRLYEVSIRIARLPEPRWQSVRSACAGEIASLVELLSGKLPEKVMEIVSRPGEGLFPSPQEIRFECSCPDWAAMCKHVAAALYGVGARLDHQPERLFELRGVDADDLVTAAMDLAPPSEEGGAFAEDELSAIFGVELEAEPPARAPVRKKRAAGKRTAKKAAVKKQTVRKTAPRKKAVRKKVVRKKAVRKKAVRKKAVRKKTVSREG